MANWLSRLFKDKRGNAMVIVCAAMPLLIGSAGLATDTIQWALWKRQLQRAADSAAIAGVYTYSGAKGDSSGVSSAVSHDLSLNQQTGLSLLSGYPQISYPSDSGSAKYQVQVKLAVQKSLSFSSYFINAPTITVSATAGSIGATGEYCMDALSSSGSGSPIYISGNAAIDMNCGLFSNGSSNNAALSKGSASVHATTVAAVGGIQQSSSWSVDSYQPYSTALDDPFADVNPSTSDMNCTTAALSDSTSQSIIGTGAGKYNCFSSLSVGSNKTLTLPSGGTYYINGGDAKIQGNLTCNSCTIVLTNKSGSTIGSITANAGANINMTAPTDGTFKGIAIYQDRRASSTSVNKINGNSASIIQGALYFPNSTINYNGTGTTDAVCTMFVSSTMEFSGNSATTNKFKKGSECGAYGLPTLVGDSRVRLTA